jgi:cytochrome c oxidase subunit 2
MSRTRFTLALSGALVALACLAPSAFAGLISPESDGSPNAGDIATLYNLILVIAAIVFVVVEGALLYSLFKYRARKGAVAAQIHGNTRLEVGWTVAAALILVVITAVTFIKLDSIKNPAASDIDESGTEIASNAGTQFASTDQPAPPKGATLNIKVDGQQYSWRYQYPGEKPVFAYEEMVVPVGMTVTLDISSDDVAHSWWIPSLGGKMDALPGYVNKTWFKATEPGTYEGQCAELCGRGHANMYARVRAVPFDEYQEWYDQTASDIESARREGAEQREQLEQSSGGQAAQGGSAAAGGASDDQTADEE